MSKVWNKTDNHNLKAKLDIRRYFLDKYNGNHIVFDCCQGSMEIWTRLQDEYDIKNYWGVDLKPKKGRLKIDSLRVLKQPGWKSNIVDIDTYGSPWDHYRYVCENAIVDTTVFLTFGLNSLGMTKLPHEFFDVMKINLQNINKSSARLNTLFVKFYFEKFPEIALTKIYNKYTVPIEIVEAISNGKARYFGVRLKVENGRENDNRLDRLHI